MHRLTGFQPVSGPQALSTGLRKKGWKKGQRGEGSKKTEGEETMQGRHTAIKMVLRAGEREQMEQWVRAHKTPQALVKRVKCLLLLADGHRVSDAHRQSGLTDRHVRKWAQRFLEAG